MNTKKIIGYIIASLIAGLLLGWLIFRNHNVTQEESHEHEQAEDITWTCTMHPQIRRHEPGKCPICGMELVPLNAAQSESASAAVHMTETAMKLANVQTTTVGYDNAVHEVRMPGKVKADERRIYTQTTHVPGRIEQLRVNFTGEQVQRGQPLAMIYSPELVTAREELLEAYKIRESQPALYKASWEKLKNWRLSEKQIDNLLSGSGQTTDFPVVADVSGIVIDKRVNLGDYVERGKPLYDIADLSQVWVLFDVYESDMPWVRKGDRVSFTVPSFPGETFGGTITFIDPVIDPQTRTASARVEVKNLQNKLKPEMLVSGVVKSQLKSTTSSLIVPKSAVLWTGERSVVYMKNPSQNGADFLLREVTLGPETGNGYVVRNGLEPGAEVVMNGTFAVDAAAQLAGKPSMMSPPETMVMTSHSEETPAGGISSDVSAAIHNITNIYFRLKDALVGDNVGGAKEQAAALQNTVAETDMALFTGEQHTQWMKYSNAITGAAKGIVSADKMEDVRNHFITLSDEVIALAKYFDSNTEPFYVLHCPMANSNKGADWLSREREIKNPYFGKKMLSCGEVKEEIK